ncbi:MAG: hypothetical protein ACLQUY_08055 [Ktedonobacterales bacterium]
MPVARTKRTRRWARYALARLSPFEVPKRIFFVRDLPRTAKGAGDRSQLAALLDPKEQRS